MLWVGLTGGIASGKSTVSRLLRARGFAVIDADQLAREVVRPGTEGHREVVAAFGPDVVSASGELDRKRIGSLVFADPVKLQELERIIHPRVRARAQELRDELAAEGQRIAFYDVPLLFEKNMQSLFDRTVAVVCPPDVQVARLMSRDGLTLEEARKRLETQLPIATKATLADAVIRNDGDLAALELEVERFLPFLNGV